MTSAIQPVQKDLFLKFVSSAENLLLKKTRVLTDITRIDIIFFAF